MPKLKVKSLLTLVKISGFPEEKDIYQIAFVTEDEASGGAIGSVLNKKDADKMAKMLFKSILGLANRKELINVACELRGYALKYADKSSKLLKKFDKKEFEIEKEERSPMLLSVSDSLIN